jgi:tRNA threonylcarbamoyl adenosine modification protein YeaZ
MKILGLDTSTKYLCLGVYDESKVYEYSLEVGRSLSSLLNVTIKRALDTLGLNINEIDYFACGLGPGSFTGMRIGVATIKGMSWAARKPIIGISTLDILASGVCPTKSLIVPAIDAKRNLLYCSAYEKEKKRLKRVRPYMLLTKDDFFKKFKSDCLLLGDAVGLYREDFLRHIKEVTILDKDYWYPQAHNIIALAQDKIKLKEFVNPFSIKPIYLYPKECQIKKFKVQN